MTSKLKSIMAPRNHRRNPSELNNASPTKENIKPPTSFSTGQSPFLPPDHPHARQYTQEPNKPRDTGCSSPQKSIEVYEDGKRGPGLHKKTKSSVSLKSLISNDKVKKPNAVSPEKQACKKPVKSKSSTSLSALLSRPKSSKGSDTDDLGESKDKENQTPPTTGDVAPTPIWAQFSSRPMDGFGTSTKVPLNDMNNVADEIALYMPLEYSPSKQRNFGDYERPTLSREWDQKSQSKSAVLPAAISTSSFTGTISKLRKRSQEISHSHPRSIDQQLLSKRQESRRSSYERKPYSKRASTEQESNCKDSCNGRQEKAREGSKVMAAVAVFNDISQGSVRDSAPTGKSPEDSLDPIAINNAFEELLDSRNIPQNVRDKMRSLNTKIKADFVRKETAIISPTSSAGSAHGRMPDIDAPKRPQSWYRSATDGDSKVPDSIVGNCTSITETPKKSRPRSLTFTRSKGDSDTKKERPRSHSRTKSSDTTSSQSLDSSNFTKALSFKDRVPRSASPDDCISYLRKVRQPQIIEVGRIQKLRQLLRNETIVWVNTFVDKGGMTEVVALLYRIMEIEWREEHEDTLLHETLLCLKGLCTTSSALQQLVANQDSLFPALLGMLFDKERKGPSEFATRGIIINLIFTYLSTSPADCLISRAHTLLRYLRDPSKPEDAQPPGFIASIYHPRPYRTWCNEMVSVTKEVFWIFLHHTNIVPFPSELNEVASYTTRHFPGERPPVPAAPYIGGVEWEATNYLAAHVDLLNGLIASMPTIEGRNALRQELKDSGFEKCMGTSLRTCKEKFYGFLHAGLTTWIGAAREDGWDTKFVKEGPCKEDAVRTPSPKKRKHEEPPKLDMPKLDLGVVGGGKMNVLDDGGWL